jgi:hypothetical protein
MLKNGQNSKLCEDTCQCGNAANVGQRVSSKKNIDAQEKETATSNISLRALAALSFLLASIAVPHLFLRALLTALDSGAAREFFRIAGRGFLDYSTLVLGNFRERSLG